MPTIASHRSYIILRGRKPVSEIALNFFKSTISLSRSAFCRSASLPLEGTHAPTYATSLARYTIETETGGPASADVALESVPRVSAADKGRRCNACALVRHHLQLTDNFIASVILRVRGLRVVWGTKMGLRLVWGGRREGSSAEYYSRSVS